MTYTTGTVAAGYAASGAEARFIWTGTDWAPLGGTDTTAGRIGHLADTELRNRIWPDLRTLLTLGGAWRAER